MVCLYSKVGAEAEAGSSSDGSDDEPTDVDDISDGEKAEILAIGKHMIRKKERVRSFPPAHFYCIACASYEPFSD